MSAQKIIDMYETNFARVIKVTGGQPGKLTAPNLAIAQKRFPERWLDTVPTHETGGRYSGTYLTTAHVIGDNWEREIALHTTII